VVSQNSPLTFTSNQKIKNMTNIELLKLIRQKIDDVRKECDDLLDSVIEDNNYDSVFDTINHIACERLYSISSDISEEINTIEI